MKQAILGLIYGIVRFGGFAFLVRKLLAKHRLTILLYHNPTAENFGKHMAYVSKRYKLVSLQDIEKTMNNSAPSKLPDYPLLVTLDDGWKENVELLPVMRKFQFRPLIFLTSQVINTKRHFWWTACDADAVEPLKQKQNRLRLELLQQQFDYYTNKEYCNSRQALDLNEIKQMQEFADFGIHTKHHPVLTQCTTAEKQVEIAGSKQETEALLGCKIRALAYPNGDYDEECIQVAKNCGLTMARTTDAGWNTAHSHPFKLKVTGASDNGSVTKLAAELTALPRFVQHVVYGRTLNGQKNKAQV